MSGATKHYGRIRPCWSCGAAGMDPCWPGCQCFKCLDPEGYKAFKESPAYDLYLQNANLSKGDDKPITRSG